MKVRLVTNARIPGDLVIEAETPAEAMLLRIWGNETRSLVMKSHGGSMSDDYVSMLIGFADETVMEEGERTRGE